MHYIPHLRYWICVSHLSVFHSAEADPSSLQFLKRLEVREKYNIKGDLLTDVLFSACCGCCSLIQVEKEVIARQSGASAAGYVAPDSMVAAPQ